ncbi:DNA topoisomerase [bacterium]|nr:DNA topoisomerase [bacterium]
MTKNLIIVESYTKTKTISKYLNSNSDNKYIVTFSQGHFCDLPKNDLGINTETWEGNYTTTKNNIANNIKKLIKDIDTIYIASDPDIEGEAIAFHISKLLKNKKFYRIKFNEITKNAITESINNPTNIDMNLVNAQETRRFLDRIVGFKLSPILWNKFNDNTLSVGRVQTVALLLCINQLNEINKHEINKFWELNGKFKSNNNILLECQSIKINDEKLINNILNNLTKESNKFYIKYEKNNINDYPPHPYTTTTLQQDAYNILKFASKKTMELSQKLYELGYITYMRTDSVNISKDFKYKLKEYIDKEYGNQYHYFRNFKNKIINAQEAHEAIRITNPNIKNLENKDDITEYHNKLYNLIWKRTISCQMKEAVFTNFHIDITSTDKEISEFKFKTNKKFLTDIGYLIIFNKEIENFEDFLENLKNIKPIEFSFISDINKPKTLYNEVSLIKKLEKEGIGRPSTYATIIEKLFYKKYVIKGSNPNFEVNLKDYLKKINKEIIVKKKLLNTSGKSKDLLLPTELGIKCINYLETIIPFLLNVDFTSQMESALDKISIGELTKTTTLNEFYNKIKHIIDKYTNTTKYNINNKKNGIIKSKYGYCYYHEKDNRYLNIESYLTWKNKNVNDLNNIEIKFLKSLPKKIDDNHELHLGKYGLYLKNIINNNNIKLDKKNWDSYIN